MLSTQEQEQIVQALRGWQFTRNTHGSLHDRGSADSYYGRNPNPHYGGVGGNSGHRVNVTDEASVTAYMAGYEDNEKLGNKKKWG